MIVLWAALALGADLPDLALIPLEGAPGTDSAAMARTVRGIAAAAQSEGGAVPMFDTDLASRMGGDEQVEAARSNLAEGRRLLAEGDADIAVAFLEQAVEAHTAAGSDIVRRGEAADAHYALARAYVATYDTDKARAELRRVIVLVPDYMATRADAVNPDITALAAEVSGSLAERPPRKLSPEGAGGIAGQLGAACVAHGAVDGDGALSLIVQNGSDVRYVVRRPGPFAPPAVGDRWYSDIAHQVVAACLGEPVPIWTPPIVPIADDGPPDPIQPHPVAPTRSRAAKRTAVAASLITVGVLGAAGGGAAYWLWPDSAASARSTWSVVVELP